MKKQILLLILIAFLNPFNFTYAQKNKNKEKAAITEQPAQPVLTDFMDSVSYIFGRDIGLRLMEISSELAMDVLSSSLSDAFAGKEDLFTPEMNDSIMIIFQSRMEGTMQQEETQSYEETVAAGSQFLDENRTKEGVMETGSGLQYKIIYAGEGEHPNPESTVTVHYRGTLIDGTLFDSSYERGEPTTFQLNKVIKGWTEGVQLMKPGAKFMFYIPPDLGYGDRSVGPIPPGSTLIFEVELISFE